ncbi:MAG: hypothetical protein GX878_06215 [Firmicutes bacterium]|nr:hypothetical protein [Bacillota bacterium]
MFWVALTMVLMALIQVPAMINQKKWPELAGYAAVWLAATVYALLITAGVPVPNPTELLRSFYSWFYPLIGVNF